MKKHGLFHYIITALYYSLTRIVFSLLGVAVTALGYIIYIGQKSPLNLILGFPLMLTGLGLTLNFLWTVVLVIISPTYNLGVCKLCSSNSAAKLTKKR